MFKINEALPGVIVVGPHSPHIEKLQEELANEVCDGYTTDHQARSSAGSIQEAHNKTSILTPVLHQYCKVLKEQVR